MLISRLAHPVRNLGFGTRATIWTQGCSLRCAGCMAVDTWPFRADRDWPAEDLAAWLLTLPQGVDGVTISGGEPTEQPELPGLLAMLRPLATARGETWDVLVFTGRDPAQVWSDWPWLFELADAVVAGPFVAAEAGDLFLMGSANQELILVSELGRERYSRPWEERPALDFAIEDGRLFLTGIPRPGELEALTHDLRQAGVWLKGRSWRGV